MGCGAGHITLAIARRFDPAHILGVELDERLVHAARQNIRHFLSHDLVVEERMRKKGGRSSSSPSREKEEEKEQVLFSLPLSFRVSRGPLCAPPLFPPSSSSSSFPNNVTFIQVSVRSSVLSSYLSAVMSSS